MLSEKVRKDDCGKKNEKEIERLRRKIEQTEIIIIGAGAGLLLLPGLLMPGRSLRNTLRILRQDIIIKICMQRFWF